MNLNYEKSTIELPESWRAKAPILLSAGLILLCIGFLCAFGGS
jgi:hypothetical protein